MPTPLFFMHDGAIDELVCIPFLASMMPTVQLSAVWITPADCLGYPTAQACSSILNFLGGGSLQCFLSDSSSERPFPWTYRQYAMMVNLLPALNPPSSAKGTAPATFLPLSKSADRAAAAVHFHDAIKAASDAANQPVTFLVTCPLTDLAMMIDEEPDIQQGIGEVVWMGSTLNVPGNIDTGLAIGANPNAEWNAYWDPSSVQAIFKSGLPLTIFPLDITNSTLLAPSTLQQYFLPNASNPVIDLVSQMYALVAFQGGFSFWDTLAAAYLGRPDLFSITQTKLDIVTDPRSPDLGNILQPTNGSGYQVNVCLNYAANKSAADFYPYLVDQLMSLNTPASPSH